MTNRTPPWAVALIKDTCRKAKLKTPKKVNWYRHNEVSEQFVIDVYASNGSTSVGSWFETPIDSFGQHWPDERVIDIFAGTHKLDQRIVLLHEIGHYIHFARHRKSGHPANFWDIAFRLWADNDIPLGYAIWRESTDPARTRSIGAWLKRQGLTQDPRNFMFEDDPPIGRDVVCCVDAAVPEVK